MLRAFLDSRGVPYASGWLKPALYSAMLRACFPDDEVLQSELDDELEIDAAACTTPVAELLVIHVHRSFLPQQDSEGIATTRAGLQAEPQALAQLASFVELHSDRSAGVRIVTTLDVGIIERNDAPFIRASPDALCSLVRSTRYVIHT